MNKALLATAACAALGLAATSQAALVVQLKPGSQIDNPGGLGAGYHAAIVNITSNVGPISAVDFGTDPAGSHKGIFGSLHQAWTVIPGVLTVPSPTGPDGGGTTDNVIDTHWSIPAPAYTAVVQSPVEDNSLAGSPLPNGATSSYGLGTNTHVATGITAALQTNSMDLAYVVWKGNTFEIAGEVQETGNSGKTPIQATLGGPVPEPATTSLLGLATLGLVARRRRAK
jgi:hypothetical protein